MIKLGGLIDLRPQWLGEAEDDKYASIGFGRYKEKGKEDDENAPTFKKDDSGKYVPTGDKAAKGGDSPAKKDTPKVNIFDKPKKDKEAPKKDKKSDTPKSDSSEKAPRDEKNRIVVPKELGLKGDRFNDDWYQKTFAWVTTKEEQNVINTMIKKSSPQVVDKVATKGLSGSQIKDGEHSQKFIDTIKKHIEKKKNEPSKPRPGNPKVNKEVRKITQDLGFTPQKLGKEEYESKMSKAAVEALTDANFHSEARKLISILEDNPEFAKNPNKDPNKPKDMFSPEYDEWRKNSVFSSEFYDSDDDIDKVAHMASNEAGWDGETAVDAIAFDLKMNGSHKLAAKIQSIFSEKNESTMRLTKMEWRK